MIEKQLKKLLKDGKLSEVNEQFIKRQLRKISIPKILKCIIFNKKYHFVMADNNNDHVISYLTLRKAVGFLGITFPIVLFLGSILFGACEGFQDSISDYHNTNMRDVFVGILSAIALFLFAYTGYDDLDYWMSKAAGIFGFMVAIFPDALDDNECTIYVKQIIPDWMATVHFISAALFFLVLAYFCIFLFTKSKGEPTPEKKKRNIIYKICGYTMIVCLVLLALYFFIPAFKDALETFKPVLILEVVMLWAFGLSWVVKGEFILSDK